MQTPYIGVRLFHRYLDTFGHVINILVRSIVCLILSSFCQPDNMQYLTLCHHISLVWPLNPPTKLQHGLFYENKLENIEAS
jgi:hypothetical protein